MAFRCIALIASALSASAFQLPKVLQTQAHKLAAPALAAAVTFHSEAAHAKSVLGVNGALDFGPLAGDQPGGEGTGKTTELKTKGTFTHRGLAVPASTAGPGVIGAMAGVTAVLTALAAFRYLTTRTFKPATHLAPTKSGSYEADESSVAIETEKLHHRRQSRTSDDTVTD